MSFTTDRCGLMLQKYSCIFTDLPVYCVPMIGISALVPQSHLRLHVMQYMTSKSNPGGGWGGMCVVGDFIIFP